MERLKLLLVLTVADIKAVGPGVWTGWKGELLRTLYYETEVVLAGGAADIARTDRVRLAQERAARRASRLDAGGLRRLCAAALPGLLAQGRAGAARQARPLRARRGGGRAHRRDDLSRPTLPRRRPSSPSCRPTIRGCSPSSPAPARRRAATSSMRRSSRPPTAWRSTRSSSRAPSSMDEDELRRAERIASGDRAGAQGRGAGSPTSSTGRRPDKERSKTFHVVPRGRHRQRAVEPPHRDRGVRASTGPACSTTSPRRSGSSTSTSPRPISRPSARRRSTSSTSPTSPARRSPIPAARRASAAPCSRSSMATRRQNTPRAAALDLWAR